MKKLFTLILCLGLLASVAALLANDMHFAPNLSAQTGHLGYHDHEPTGPLPATIDPHKDQGHEGLSDCFTSQHGVMSQIVSGSHLGLPRKQTGKEFNTIARGPRERRSVEGRSHAIHEPILSAPPEWAREMRTIRPRAKVSAS